MSVTEGEFMLTELVVQTAISNRLIQMTEERDAALRARIVSMFVASLEQPYHVISYPKDWWQACKNRWFPGWLKGRFPIEYHVERLARYCPHKAVAEDEPHFQFLRGAN